MHEDSVISADDADEGVSEQHRLRDVELTHCRLGIGGGGMNIHRVKAQVEDASYKSPPPPVANGCLVQRTLLFRLYLFWDLLN